MIRIAVVSLSFLGSESPSLHQIKFEHPLLSMPIISERGNNSSTGKGFSWSKGVQALSLFFTRASLIADSKSQISVVLSGEANSAAASLDYAIARQSAWLMDSFGLDSENTCLINRIIKRSNPERKRPGPVSIALANSIAAQNIQISIDGKLLDFTEKSALAKKLQLAWPGETAPISQIFFERPNSDSVSHDATKESPDNQSATVTFLSGLIANECYRALTFRDALGDVENLKTSLCRDAAFSRDLGKNVFRLNASVKSSTTSFRRGIFSQRVLEDAANRLRSLKSPLKFSITGANVGTYMLFLFLKDELKIPLEIDHNFVHAGELLERWTSGSVDEKTDLCGISVGQIPSLLNSKQAANYRPIIALPRASFALIGKRSRKGAAYRKKIAGDLQIANAYPASSTNFLGSLFENGDLQKRSVKLVTADPYQMLSSLQNSARDEHAVLWFPYYQLSNVFSDTHRLDTATDEQRYKLSVLFCHRALIGEPAIEESLQILLRDAWLSILESPLLLQKYAVGMASLPEIRKFFMRASGFYDMEAKVQELNRCHPVAPTYGAA